MTRLGKAVATGLAAMTLAATAAAPASAAWRYWRGYGRWAAAPCAPGVVARPWGYAAYGYVPYAYPPYGSYALASYGYGARCSCP